MISPQILIPTFAIEVTRRELQVFFYPVEYIIIIIIINYSYSFRCFQSDGEFISDFRHSDRESTFAQVKFCFRHNKSTTYKKEIRH